MVGTNAFIPWTMWLKMIIKIQAYSMKRALFCQDNKNVMKMERNGLNSSGDDSRHINIRY